MTLYCLERPYLIIKSLSICHICICVLSFKAAAVSGRFLVRRIAHEDSFKQLETKNIQINQVFSFSLSLNPIFTPTRNNPLKLSVNTKTDRSHHLLCFKSKPHFTSHVTLRNIVMLYANEQLKTLYYFSFFVCLLACFVVVIVGRLLLLFLA